MFIRACACFFFFTSYSFFLPSLFFSQVPSENEIPESTQNLNAEGSNNTNHSQSISSDNNGTDLRQVK